MRLLLIASLSIANQALGYRLSSSGDGQAVRARSADNVNGNPDYRYQATPEPAKDNILNYEQQREKMFDKGLWQADALHTQAQALDEKQKQASMAEKATASPIVRCPRCQGLLHVPAGQFGSSSQPYPHYRCQCKSSTSKPQQQDVNRHTKSSDRKGR